MNRPALALTAVALAGLLVPALGSTTAAPVPRCHTPDLAVSLGRIAAGLGNVEVNVYLRNRSAHTCYVRGYAGFGLEDSGHGVQPSHVRRGSTYFQADPGPRRVVLRPGDRAVTNLAWTDNPFPGEPRRGNCEPLSAWLEVTPPDEHVPLLVRFGTSVCGHGALASSALAWSRP